SEGHVPRREVRGRAAHGLPRAVPRRAGEPLVHLYHRVVRARCATLARVRPRRARALVALGVFSLLTGGFSCKKEPEAAPAPAAPPAPAPKVPTVTRYAAENVLVYSALDAGEPLDGVHLGLFSAVEVASPDAGRTAYYVDGGLAGWLDTRQLLAE